MDKWLEHCPLDQDVVGSNPSSYSKRLFVSLSLKALDVFSGLSDETTVTQQQEKKNLSLSLSLSLSAKMIHFLNVPR